MQCINMKGNTGARLPVEEGKSVLQAPKGVHEYFKIYLMLVVRQMGNIGKTSWINSGIIGEPSQIDRRPPKGFI